LAISTAAVLIAAEIHVAPPGGLTVHEWGTFTSVAGEDGTTIDWDVLGGNNDLPRFVINRGGCFKFRLTGAVRMETPVIYFYSPRAVKAHVRVGFPQGIITEWYPQAEDPNPHVNIEWNVNIEPNTTPALPREDAPSHYYAARATDAAPVAFGNQHEKFLFYRGVGRFEVPLSARLTADGKVAVADLGADPVPLVILFENRGGKIGYRSAGALSGSATLDPVSLDGALPPLHRDLENALVAQGLFRKEAQAMVDTWRDSWFEEGSRLIYIVPSRFVDEILPLQVQPPPAQTARVFVGRIELITPATKRSVQDAMAANDRSVIVRYGRFLDPILKRIASENPASARQIDAFRMTVQNSFSGIACRQ